MTSIQKLRFAVDLLNGCHLLPPQAQQAKAVLLELVAEVDDPRPVEPPKFRLPGVSRAPDEQ